MALSTVWRKHLELLGFGTGAALDSCGQLVTIRDVLGGPLLHKAAGVAVSVRPAEDGLNVALARREGNRWTIRHESHASQPASVKDALVATAGEYYHAIHDHVSRQTKGHAA